MSYQLTHDAVLIFGAVNLVAVLLFVAWEWLR